MRLIPLFLLVIISLTLVTAGPITAQDGPTADDLATVNRVANAFDNLESYSSYVREGAYERRQVIQISQGTDIYRLDTSYSRFGLNTVLQDGDSRNIHSEGTLQFEEVESEGEETQMSAFTMNVEARLVDDVLYVQGNYEEGGENPPDVSDGWVTVAGPDDWPLYDVLNLESYLDPDIYSPLRDRDLLAEVVSSVHVEADTVNGMPVDVITLSLDSAGLSAFMIASIREESPFNALLDVLDLNSAADFTVVVDADDNLVEYYSLMLVQATNVDLYALAPDTFPEGMFATLYMEVDEYGALVLINEPLDPVAAPE